MNDGVIRIALLQHLLQNEEDRNSILVSEMGLNEGSAIIDIAHINGIMWGYEIKSDVDTLYRLTRQIEVYQKFFQKLTIVTTKAHLSKIRKDYPQWIGIMLAYEEDGSVLIKELRRPKLNRKTSKQEITSLIWRDEARMLLSSKGIKGISSAPRHQLWHKMAEICDEEELISIVKETMRSRRAWQVVA